MEETVKSETSVGVPVSVQVIAVLLIIGGTWALLGMIVRLMCGAIYFDFSALGIFVGPGLLRLRNGWRRFTLIASVLYLVLFVVLVCISLMEEGPVVYEIMGLQQGYVLKWALWSVLASYGFFMVWVALVLMRPSVRALFHSQGKISLPCDYPKPYWSTFWVICLLVVYIGLNMNCISMAQSCKYKPKPVWVYGHQSFGKGDGEKWAGTFEWRYPGLDDQKITRKQSGQIVVVASKEGEEIACCTCNYELGYGCGDFQTYVLGNDYPLSVRFTDRSSQVNPEYTIRSTVYWDTGVLDMKFALVSTKDDDSESFIYFPDGPSSPRPSFNSYSYCPKLNVMLRSSPDLAESYGIVKEVFATGVTNLPASRGMFPGATQPIDWSFRFHSENPDESKSYCIPAGETSDPKKRI